MKKTLAALALGGALLSASCAAGPHQLRRSVDDFDHKLYQENPLLNGVLWVVPVFPILSYGAMIGDFLVVDAYHFWAKDVWRQEGTTIDRWTPSDSSHKVNSLLIGGPFLHEVE
jgi:hypothetical protein